MKKVEEKGNTHNYINNMSNESIKIEIHRMINEIDSKEKLEKIIIYLKKNLQKN